MFMCSTTQGKIKGLLKTWVSVLEFIVDNVQSLSGNGVLLLCESSGEGNGRKDDSFLPDSLLKFLLIKKVKATGRSFGLVVFPSFTHVCFLQAELVLARYCVLAMNNIPWGHFISKSTCMITLSPRCSFSSSVILPSTPQQPLQDTGASQTGGEHVEQFSRTPPNPTYHPLEGD